MFFCIIIIFYVICVEQNKSLLLKNNEGSFHIIKSTIL